MKFKCIFLLICFIPLIYSCEDIFEDDISKRVITINQPPDNHRTTDQNVFFWWEDLKDTDNFQLTVVEGSFDQVNQFVLDTLISNNQFSFLFSPGSYQWRIRGHNNTSATEYHVQSFIIDTTSNLSLVQPFLNSPKNDTIISGNLLTLRWRSIFGVSEYILEIREPDRNGNTFSQDTLNGQLTGFVISELPENNYEWGLKAINASSQSNYSWASFEIDKTKPSIPSLGSANVIGNVITLNWTSGSDKNFLVDSLLIYSDPGLSDVVKAVETELESYTDSSLTSGTFFWQVKSIDKAGNIGDFADSKQFTIQ